MKPLYVPKGKAKEYGDYAVNIYTGCPHRCYYCFAPNVLHRDRETFHTHVEPRPGLVEALKQQLERENIKGQLIHLCFTCDPYPTGYDSSVTRAAIKTIKASGNHLYSAKECGISTWVSCEPVLNPAAVLDMLSNCHDFIDKVKIGKLNYHKSNINWKKFGQDAERLCQKLGLDYYIKDSLRKEMEG